MEKFNIAPLIKVGNSVAVIIPKKFLKALNWQRGDQVFFYSLGDHQLTVKLVIEDEVRKFKRNIIEA